jgi:hypothetical protein
LRGASRQIPNCAIVRAACQPSTLEQLRRDEKWLARASNAIASYWRERNARRQKAGGRT